MIALNLVIVSPDPPSSLPFQTQLKTFLQNHFRAGTEGFTGGDSHQCFPPFPPLFLLSANLTLLSQEFQQHLGGSNTLHTPEAAEQLQGNVTPRSDLSTGP